MRGGEGHNHLQLRDLEEHRTDALRLLPRLLPLNRQLLLLPLPLPLLLLLLLGRRVVVATVATAAAAAAVDRLLQARRSITGIGCRCIGHLNVRACVHWACMRACVPGHGEGEGVQPPAVPRRAAAVSPPR